MVTQLPNIEKFNFNNINSKEAFKRALDIFLNCLISQNMSHKFNYVSREALLFLELNTPLVHDKLSIAPGSNFVDEFMNVMDRKAN